MTSTVLGIPVLAGFWQLFLIVIRLRNVARKNFAGRSFIGVVVRHLFYRPGLLQRKLHPVNSTDARARSDAMARMTMIETPIFGKL